MWDMAQGSSHYYYPVNTLSIAVVFQCSCFFKQLVLTFNVLQVTQTAHFLFCAEIIVAWKGGSDGLDFFFSGSSHLEVL